MKIYIVNGTTGEYSDRSEWAVEAWTTKEAAEARVRDLGDKLQASGVATLGYGDQKRAAEEKFRTDPDGDPGFSCDYTGTSWFVTECELRNATPEGRDAP